MTNQDPIGKPAKAHHATLKMAALAAVEAAIDKADETARAGEPMSYFNVASLGMSALQAFLTESGIGNHAFDLHHFSKGMHPGELLVRHMHKTGRAGLSV